MESGKIEILKRACLQFYLNLELDKPTITDQEFDQLRKEYEADGKSIMEFLKLDDQITAPCTPEIPVEKEAIMPNEFKSRAEEFIGEHPICYITPKYDGCAVKALYENGKLKMIQSTPDEKTGIIRTRSLWKLFPHELDKNIRSLRGEALVDCDKYGHLARNKANGLVNSKDKIDECESELFIRIYGVEFTDDENPSLTKYWDTIKSLPIIKRGEEIAFGPAAILSSEVIPETPLVKFEDGNFQIDGLVCYAEGIKKAFKFYYTESAEVEIKNVLWTEQSNGSWSATLEFDEVTLNDKTISKASSNGVRKMVEEGYGRGAKVRVILANTTIPKIIEVIERSDDFQFPSCDCGHQFTADDVFGSVLKCTSTDSCISKVNRFAPQIAQWLLEDDLFRDKTTTVQESIKLDPVWFGYSLMVDRWDPFDHNLINDENRKECSELLEESLKFHDLSKFKSWIEFSFEFTTELQERLVEVNQTSAFTVLCELYDLNSFEKIKDLMEA